MRVLLTGAAGFIGFHAASRFLARGDTVVGLDDLNPYYPVALKRARLAELAGHAGFTFHEMDVARPDLAGALGDGTAKLDAIVHLAAQAGVRYSVENPHAYVHANVAGQVSVLELAAARGLPVVYASSSSVYGDDSPVPFAEDAPAARPVSVYAATKRSGELIAHAYGQIHGLTTTGLRFFTVYGRYGRPDMAPWLFTDAILAGRPIKVFNGGDMERDFTHVDDIAAGVVAVTDRLLARPDATAPLYNLGNNRPVRLLDFIAAIERAAGRRAVMEMAPKPAGDVTRTCADIALAARDLGYSPTVPLADGIADFVAWFRAYHATAR
ncbi:NAD-dependent epimerase/dehydratase family protein [Aquibium sp. A9E412]|uniref:NAD-dependent epimerase/dehydratase family protein n=1 Tax=Aquibium sp. A9E412 TaxID=2976767 RepID=UPI0025AEED1D|nr:NAD-dependent epimerase/dehydratase family protein [Aquibium sp. A9E412]MDN2566077.1 NAD-dependent epimerase/dehydratase family protein [Aquibium sp. A9E412]